MATLSGKDINPTPETEIPYPRIETTLFPYPLYPIDPLPIGYWFRGDTLSGRWDYPCLIRGLPHRIGGDRLSVYPLYPMDGVGVSFLVYGDTLWWTGR